MVYLRKREQEELIIAFRRDFFWFFATASNQFEVAWIEDGKGASVSDHCTNGSHTIPKRITSRRAGEAIWHGVCGQIRRWDRRSVQKEEGLVLLV